MSVTRLSLSTIAVIVLSIIFMVYNYRALKRMDEGTPEMASLAKAIRDGSYAFMRKEYGIIIPAVISVAILISLFIEKSSGYWFLVGSSMSSIACVSSMIVATFANVRTTQTAAVTLNIGDTEKTALRGGSICGLSTHTCYLIGLILIIMIYGLDPFVTGRGYIPVLACNSFSIRLTAYCSGCSVVAMFNRVAGGNFTKAADIGADIVGKNRHDLPEDDIRNPLVVADQVGDNVNDIAGNGSDLLESSAATVIGAILLARYSYAVGASDLSLFYAACKYPIVLAVGGLFCCILGLLYATTHRASDDPSHELNMATYISAFGVITVSIIAAAAIFGNVGLDATFRFGWGSPCVAAVLGIASGVGVGRLTEYYTDPKYPPVKGLIAITPEGSAFLGIKGIALGFRSTLAQGIVIIFAMQVANFACGIYGIAISAVGMLSFVGTTVSVDAFGPIADNAGGIAESCQLGHAVRRITDKLDTVGNTTAAIGKGFAIGSAAFATVSLIYTYISSYSEGAPDLNVAIPGVTGGAIFGGLLVFYFGYLLMNNTIDSAKLMANAGEEQLSLISLGEMSSPDYVALITQATTTAIHRMLVPSVLAVVVPAVCGIAMGVGFVGGILFGATIVAIPTAIFMSTAGGAWDNNKKAYESGLVPGYEPCNDDTELDTKEVLDELYKNVHRIAVIGDTMGDVFKDVNAVAYDIFIKLMSTTANLMSPIFLAVHAA